MGISNCISTIELHDTYTFFASILTQVWPSRLLKNPAMSFRKHFLRHTAKNWHIRNPVKSMASPLSLWTPLASDHFSSDQMPTG
jgi:hypothetical protein